MKRPIPSGSAKNLETAHASVNEGRTIVDQDLNAIALSIEEHMFGRGPGPFSLSLSIDRLHGITPRCRRYSQRIEVCNDGRLTTDIRGL